MADRCEHCLARMDGHEIHADDCPTRGPEFREQIDRQKDLLTSAGQWLHALAPLSPRAPEIRKLADEIFEELEERP